MFRINDAHQLGPLPWLNRAVVVPPFQAFRLKPRVDLIPVKGASSGSLNDSPGLFFSAKDVRTLQYSKVRDEARRPLPRYLLDPSDSNFRHCRRVARLQKLDHYDRKHLPLRVVDAFTEELAIETGKIAMAPLPRSVEGPMGEYCLHLAVLPGIWHAWVTATHRRTKKGIRYKVSRVFVSTDPTKPEEATDKVAEITCESRWLVLGDLIFVHSRDPRGSQKTDCHYNRAMSAIRKGRNLGGLYSVSTGGNAIALRVGLKEARLPVQVSSICGHPNRIVIDVQDQTEQDGGFSGEEI